MLPVAVLLPPGVAPPLVSLTAPVVTVIGEVPRAVGVPVTLHVIAAPTATGAVVGTLGVQTAIKPAGKPAISQVAPGLAAATAAGGVFVQV